MNLCTYGDGVHGCLYSVGVGGHIGADQDLETKRHG